MLEGTSNYHVWLATIQSFLISLKIWTVASGTSTCPTIKGLDHNAWIDSDYQAVGIISLYVKEDLRTAIVQTYEDPIISRALRTLANLARLYATTSTTGQFYWLKDIVNWRLRGRDPSAEITHLIKLFNRLSGTGLVLPDTLRAMLLCTGLGNNYATFTDTAACTISLTDFTTAKLIPMILAESKRQSTDPVNHIAPSSYSNTSTCCKICRGSSHTTENCWKLTGKPGSKASGNQTKNTQQQQQQQKPGNQDSRGNTKGKRHGKGKRIKGKGRHMRPMLWILPWESTSRISIQESSKISVMWTSPLIPPGRLNTMRPTFSLANQEKLQPRW